MRRKSSGGEQLEQLTGELVAFRRVSEDGWGVGTLRTPTERDVSIVGKVLDARVGDALELAGKWVVHSRYGDQFRISQCVTSRAVSVGGVVRWLAETLPGIGLTRARTLVDHFGGVDALWQVIELDHARLAEVDGITPERAEAIARTYGEQRARRDHEIKLRGWGLTTNQIQKCLDEWKTLDEVVEKISCNPYLLARHVQGFGFERADDVARLAGVAHDAPERIDAGIVYTLEKAMHEGHCFLYGGALQKIAAEVLHVTFDDVARGIVRATQHKTIVRRGKRVYTARMETSERSCAESLGRIMRSGRELAALAGASLH